MSTIGVENIRFRDGVNAITLDSSGNTTFNKPPKYDSYAFHAYLSSTLTSQTSSANIKIPFDATHLNLGNVYNTTSSKFIAPVNGYYWFSSNVRMQNQGANARVDLAITVNGVGKGSSGQNQTLSNDMGVQLPGLTLDLNANDEVEIYINANGGSSFNILTTSNLGTIGTGGRQAMTYLSGYLISRK